MDNDNNNKSEGNMAKVAALIKEYPNFPKKGILFRDLHPIMTNVEAREIVLQFLIDR